MAQKIQARRDAAANWTQANPTLADGERGYDKTSKRYKTGDGVTPWNGLAYDKIKFADIEDPPAAQDLSGYATTAAVNQALAEYTKTAQLDATFATDAQLAAALATIDGGNAAG